MKFQTFVQKKLQQLARQRKHLKRKILVLKMKFFLLGVLPVVIVLLAVKTLQTLLRVKLRDSVSSVRLHGDSSPDSLSQPVIKPVSQTFSKPEFVTPVPVSQTVSPWESDASAPVSPTVFDDKN